MKASVLAKSTRQARAGFAHASEPVTAPPEIAISVLLFVEAIEQRSARASALESQRLRTN
jgi:hypothetical protein